MAALRSIPRLRLLLLLGALASSGACEAQTTGSPSPTVRQAGAGAEAEPGYTVHVELPPETTRGQEAIARVRVHPKAPWHMNLEYPAKLRLEAPADVELVNPLLHKADAERYDDQGLEFSVLFTPQGGGARKITAQLDFAVCGAASCGPISESVELAFEVGCRVDDTGLC